MDRTHTPQPPPQTAAIAKASKKEEALRRKLASATGEAETLRAAVAAAEAAAEEEVAAGKQAAAAAASARGKEVDAAQGEADELRAQAQRAVLSLGLKSRRRQREQQAFIKRALRGGFEGGKER